MIVEIILWLVIVAIAWFCIRNIMKNIRHGGCGSCGRCSGGAADSGCGGCFGGATGFGRGGCGENCSANGETKST